MIFNSIPEIQHILGQAAILAGWTEGLLQIIYSDLAMRGINIFRGSIRQASMH